MNGIPKIVQIRRKATITSIQQDPIKVQLKRSSKKQGRGGGFDSAGDPDTLPEQTFKLYSYGQLWRAGSTEEVGGTSKEVLWSLLAEYDANIQRGDYFTWNNRHFIVKFVRPQSLNGYIVEKQVEIREELIGG